MILVSTPLLRARKVPNCPASEEALGEPLHNEQILGTQLNPAIMISAEALRASRRTELC